MPARLQKLSEPHLRYIWRQTALSMSAAKIGEAIREGRACLDGVKLGAVDITDSLVSHHRYTDAGQTAIENERERLYGDARAHPSYWVGWRLSKLEGVLSELRALAADPELDHSDRARYYRLFVQTMGEVRKQFSNLRPGRHGEGARHLHLHQHAGGDVAGDVARQMQELAAAGLLGDALESIAARNASRKDAAERRALPEPAATPDAAIG